MNTNTGIVYRLQRFCLPEVIGPPSRLFSTASSNAFGSERGSFVMLKRFRREFYIHRAAGVHLPACLSRSVVARPYPLSRAIP